MLHGSCLCGEVTFKIEGQPTDIYQCHCSLCRKTTGTACASLFLSAGRSFHWRSGKDNIQLHVTSSGYRSVFCRTCGSRLPDANPEETTYWIPAGLIDDPEPGIQVGAHVFVGSKAPWDKIGDDGIQYEEHFSN